MSVHQENLRILATEMSAKIYAAPYALYYQINSFMTEADII